MFTYAVKTELHNDQFNVIAWGTKKEMLKYAETFDAHKETLESKITRRKDGKVVHHFKR